MTRIRRSRLLTAAAVVAAAVVADRLVESVLRPSATVVPHGPSIGGDTWPPVPVRTPTAG